MAARAERKGSMERSSIARYRLVNHRIANPTLEKPSDVVSWLGAVQAQDYLGSLWAIGLRQRSSAEADIERAIADRTIVRTWPMRGTLHWVAAADVRWMLALLTPRLLTASARRHRELELDASVFARCRRLIVRALSGGKQVRRTTLYQILNAAGISTDGSRGLHVLGHLAQEGLICFGARDGKQPTFVLLDDWVPNATRRERDEALAEVARRYFAGHGPATVADFRWWSGLSTVDTRAGIAMATPRLTNDVVEDQTFWFAESTPATQAAGSRAYLLPAFDEYTVGYQDRRAILDPSDAKKVNAGGGMLNPVIVIGGHVVGTWRRTRTADSVVVTPLPFKTLGPIEKQAVAAAARRYGGFLRRPVVIDYSSD